NNNNKKQKVYRQCWRGCGEKATLLRCWWEYKLVQPLWKTVWRFLKKLKIELPFDPIIPLLGVYPEKTMTKKIHVGVPVVAQWLTNLTRNHGVAGSVPGLAQWVNDLVLL
uniref:Uncharacterized protein n=1 Tax=Sus scrofa TaxID=9823 RepID=A0A8D1X7E0_PIG